VGGNPSRWFIALVLGLGAGALPVAGSADTGPVPLDPPWRAGENLLWASPGFAPADAVQQWLDSPAHRKVLLTKSWRELGIGVVSAVTAPGTYGGRDVQIAAAEFGLRRH
jgi:hypothetical protein